MAVSLPSDVVADVMRNAEPARREAAVSKLQSVGSSGEGSFASAIGRASSEGAASAFPDAESLPSPIMGSQKTASPYQGFEQMVLRNLFETLLPGEDSGAFGGGPSAGVWRSMAADQLAQVYTNSGGIGIQAMLSPSANQPGPQREVGWPYFSMRDIGLLRG